MHPKEGEASSAFVMRVETARRRMQIDPASTYHTFVKRDLDFELRQQLDIVRRSKKASGATKFGWEDVVTVCRDLQLGCTLAVEPAPSSVSRPSAGAPG